ncbi:MAG: AraC family transcriptional regulator [Paracoccaceae bacterium]
MAEITPPNSPFRVVPLPRFAQGGRWRTEAMRSYSQPSLIWFTKGQGRITVAGSTRGFGAHNAVFLPAGTMHGFEMSGQVFGSLVYFPNDDSLGLPVEPLHLRFRDAHIQAELTQLIDNLQREAERDMPGHDRALIFHGGLLAVWLERQLANQPEAEAQPDKARRLTAAYTALVERDFRSGKSVNDYAAELGVTPTHLSRVCNTACGRPASALLADRVHYEARRLLAETRTPVKDIARGLGFTSAAYFTRAFQKKTGKTPTGFRKNG